MSELRYRTHDKWENKNRAKLRLGNRKCRAFLLVFMLLVYVSTKERSNVIIGLCIFDIIVLV